MLYYFVGVPTVSIVRVWELSTSCTNRKEGLFHLCSGIATQVVVQAGCFKMDKVREDRKD
jgi:hypothetical protein